jgi:hypothetical protein
MALRLRGFHTAAHPDARKRREIPSQGWALLHSLTDSTLHDRVAPRCRPGHAPSEVLSPTASCQSRGATYTRPGPTPAGYVAPSGFRTLSTPCSPRDLPGLFHPGSAHGVPLRGLSLHGAVRPLERRTPRVFGWALAGFASPSGIEHTMEILHAGLGFSQVTAPMPPWDWPLRGFLLPTGVDRATSPRPLSRFVASVAC